MAYYIYFDDNREHNPTEYCEPYCLFDRKFSDLEGKIESQEIKICIFPARRGTTSGFSIDRFYFSEPTLRFRYSKLINGTEGTNAVLIHHTLEYEFNMSYQEVQQQMAEEIKSKEASFFIPGVKQLEMSYRLGQRNIQLIFDVVSDESAIQTVSKQLISMDIMLFARGW